MVAPDHLETSDVEGLVQPYLPLKARAKGEEGLEVEVASEAGEGVVGGGDAVEALDRRPAVGGQLDAVILTVGAPQRVAVQPVVDTDGLEGVGDVTTLSDLLRRPAGELRAEG